MKKLVILSMSMLLLLSGCSSNISRTNDGKIKDTEDKSNAVIQNYQLSEDSYRMVFPFKPSQSRGVVAKLNTRLDMKEYEMGLMRLSKDVYPTSKYYYQEGQYLDKKTTNAWLKRKYTDAQFKALEKGTTETIENIGLNPVDDEKGTLEERNEKSPLYLSNIIEQDFMLKNSKGKLELGGISIGLAMNSVHYFNQEKGYPRETAIPNKVIEAEGKKIAAEVVMRLRQIGGLEDVPIFVTIFRQESKSSIVPGSFILRGTVPKSGSSVKGWERVNEKYVLFPSSEGTKKYRDDSIMMDNFKNDIIDYFPNYTGVIGRGFYMDGRLTKLSIDVPIQFYSQTEVVGFTQYVAGLVVKRFPKEIMVEVNISSVTSQEALIVRKRGVDKPEVHIY